MHLGHTSNKSTFQKQDGGGEQVPEGHHLRQALEPCEHRHITYCLQTSCQTGRMKSHTQEGRVPDGGALGEEKVEEEAEDGAEHTGRPPLCLRSLFLKKKRSEASTPCADNGTGWGCHRGQCPSCSPSLLFHTCVDREAHS